MKKYLFIIAIAISLNAESQPILTASTTNAAIGEHYNWIDAAVISSAGASGPNQIWDFSTLVTNNIQQGTIVNPDYASHGSSFPSANISIFIQGIYNSFYNANIDSLSYLGGGSTSWVQSYSDGEKYLIYPFTYNSTFTDSYSGTYSSMGTIKTIVGSVTVIGDGYGTIQLPYITLTNVLRVKIIENEVQTTNGIPTNRSYTRYFFYYPGVHQPVLILTANGNYYPQYISDLSIGVNENEFSTDFPIYPNPAKDNISLHTPLKSSIEITTLQGHIVKSFNTLDKLTTIDVSSFASGIYFVKSSSENGVLVKKFIKE